MLFDLIKHIQLSLSAIFEGIASLIFMKMDQKNNIITSNVNLKRSQVCSVNETDQITVKGNIQKSKKERYKATLTELRTHINDSQKH